MRHRSRLDRHQRREKFLVAREEAAVELAAYLAMHDDEGNGWLRYADTLTALGRHDEVRTVVAKGIDAATRHGHSSMVEEFEERYS